MTRARSLPSGGEAPRNTEREPESGEHTELIPVMMPSEARRSPDQTAPPPEDPLRGTPYRFVQALSTGGEMGEIVEAEHTALRRRVIVKLLGAKLAGSEDFADRMRLEGQALAAAAHPNVVSVLDVGKTREGRAYLVMEKLVGRTLAEELAARGFVSVVEAVALVRQLLDGLDAAHGAGVVHRDVKPANLFICDVRRGPRVLKILDFGVAKLVRRRAGAGGPEPLAHPTVTGAMVGTPRWMAPEQILTEPVGPPTDIYSAGAVLYALVAGHDPFNHHRDRSGVLQAHVGERPPVPSIGAPQAIPPAVEHAIMKALEKRREDRWASAAEMSEALERALAADTPVSETRPATLPAPARQNGRPHAHDGRRHRDPVGVSARRRAGDASACARGVASLGSAAPSADAVADRARRARRRGRGRDARGHPAVRAPSTRDRGRGVQASRRHLRSLRTR